MNIAPGIREYLTFHEPNGPSVTWKSKILFKSVRKSYMNSKVDSLGIWTMTSLEAKENVDHLKVALGFSEH